MTTERIEAFYRDATYKDVLRAMNGEKIEARFRDAVSREWPTDFALGGWHNETSQWLDNNGTGWKFCQVYEPPQWYVDKPEPGEGYRLLGKFPDEPVLAGDFIKDVDGAWRELVSPCNPVQGMTCWYRRRIEESKPEPKHYTLNVGDTADVPSGHRITALADGIEVQ